MPVLFSEKIVAELIESKFATLGITVLILINAVTLGMETNNELSAQFGNVLNWIDRTILIIFQLRLH